MGAFGEAFAAFAQPLIDQTDGSPEGLQKALGLSQLCYNTALLPPDKREEMFAEMKASLGMEADEFEGFRRSLLEPMIARHEAMFPLLHQRLRTGASANDSPSDSPAGDHSSWTKPDWLAPEPRPFASEPRAALPEKKSTIDRYAPCPCGSGKKFKFCCGATKPR
jgi:uncharacterized protein YecA (UPF0149 family)